MIAASTSAFDRVGCWTTNPALLNATTPILMLEGWSATNTRAAFFAAAMRVGWRSFARMLFETSKARMTVPSRAWEIERRLRAGEPGE